MKTCILLFFLLLSIPGFSNKNDSIIQKQKGWYFSAAVTRTYLFPPLINTRGNNAISYIVHPVTVFAGYRIKPKIRTQLGLSYLSMNFDKSFLAEYFHYPYDYKADDKGKFLNIDLQIKGNILNQRYRLQPYLALGTIARNYWVQQNHILYDSETRQEVSRINNKFSGTLFYGTVNPGLQFRFLSSFEIFTELNLRYNFDKIDDPKHIWRYRSSMFNGFSSGLTYHLPNKK